LDEPGLEINFLFRKVRDSVLQETNGKQEPFTYGSLPGSRLYLKSARPKPAQPEKQPGLQLSEAAQIWAVTQDSKSTLVLEAFRKAYEGTPFSALARARISELNDIVKRQTSSQPADPKSASNKTAQEVVPEIHTENKTENKIASIASEPEPEITGRFASDKELVRGIQQALNRHRCDAGRVDGAWGRKGREAAARFARFAKLSLGSAPSEEMFDTIDQTSGKVCPLACGAKYNAKGGKCVLKKCGKGKRLSNSGSCLTTVKKKSPKKRARKTARAARAKSSSTSTSRNRRPGSSRAGQWVGCSGSKLFDPC